MNGRAEQPEQCTPARENGKGAFRAAPRDRRQRVPLSHGAGFVISPRLPLSSHLDGTEWVFKTGAAQTLPF